MKNPDLLWEYQCLEQKKVQFLKQSKAIPEIIELRSLKEQIENAQELIRNLSQKKETLKKALKTKESGVSLLKDKMSKAETELYGGNIQGSREIEAAQKNVSVIKEKIEEEEEEAFIELEKLEKIDSELEPLLKELQEKKNRFRKINQEYIDKKEEIVRESGEIKNRQEIIALKIDSDEWNEYHKLCKRYPDKTAIGVLDNGVCSGCHMTVSFEQLKKSKHEPGIVCDNCGRWLLIR